MIIQKIKFKHHTIEINPVDFDSSIQDGSYIINVKIYFYVKNQLYRCYGQNIDEFVKEFTSKRVVVNHLI